MDVSSRRIVGSALFAVSWIALAVFRPTTTYHLAPLIVAAWPAVGERTMERAITLSIVGFAVASATTGLLSVTGSLQGPSLLPWGGPALESLVSAAAGMVIGVVPAAVARPGAPAK